LGLKKRKFDYDPSGLRTFKSITQPATNAALQARFVDHTPLPEWVNHEDEIVANAKKKGIPVTFGRRFKYDMPAEYNQLRW